MSHSVYKYTTLARPLEADYASNRAVLILLPVIALALAGLDWQLRDAEPVNALVSGLTGALAAFLVWALGREVDPDRNASAFFALGVVTLLLALGIEPAVWTLAFTLMATRLVNRTVGPPAKPVDFALVLALAALAIWRDGYVLLGVVAAVAIAIEIRLGNRAPAYWLLALVGIVLSIVLGDPAAVRLGPASLSIAEQAVWALTLLGGLILVLTCPTPTSRCDAVEAPLERMRIRAALLVLWLAVLGSPMATGSLLGSAALLAALPLWCVLIGVMVMRLIHAGPARSDRTP
ncbi:hypothetical protein [Maricaulis sp. CAU 1757]